MIGHQREVLAQLGIDIWVTRDTLCQEITQPSIWRDQALPEIITNLAIQRKTFEKNVVTQETPVIRTKVKEQKITVEVIQTEDKPKLEIDAFSLQALKLNHVVIILNSTEINAEQQQLWGNIQRALQAEFFELNWPFTLPEMNDGQGVENYIQGFIDMIATEKLMISLGEIPHWSHPELTTFASLQEMLNQPLLKRKLWNFIQSK